MISVSSSKLSLSQKSAKVLAAAVLILFCCQSALASPLGGGMPRPSSSSVNSNDQLESKSRSGPAEVLLVEDDSSSIGASNPLPLTMEALENRLVARQPPVRMLRSPALPPMFFEQEEESSEAAPSSARNIASPEQQEQMARLLAQYFRLTNGGAGSNRFPRRVSSTSKRAAAMGVDLPDYILHINKGRNFDFSTFREKMQKSG